MKTIRSMVLVSSDPLSMERGAQQVFENLQSEIKSFGLEDEISISMVGDIGRHDALPLVIVYPEAIIYGPVKPEDTHLLVEEHLYKGRIASELTASSGTLRQDRLGKCPQRHRTRRAADRSSTRWHH